jgi:hypothetical protein
MEPSSSFTATVAGHSYVKYLQRDMLSGQYPTNFGLAQFKVELFHASGAHTMDLYHHI